MIEITGDLWDLHARGEWIVIPTNRAVNASGKATMGKGLALEAARRYPTLPKLLGQVLRSQPGTILALFPEKRIIALPTKEHWRDTKSSLPLIEEGCRQLHSHFKNSERPVFLPQLGCGVGALLWEDVRAAIAPLLPEEHFVVVSKEKP